MANASSEGDARLPKAPKVGDARPPRQAIDLRLAREVAVAAVLDACRLCQEVQASLVAQEVVKKPDRTPVTVADFGAQALISARLFGAFPDIPLVGEEDASQLRTDSELNAKVQAAVHRVAGPAMSGDQVLEAVDRGLHEGGSGTFWVLDPIDGTKGFLRREQYAVCLGLIQDGVVLVAVLGCPNLPVDPGADLATAPMEGRGCLFISVHGEGATQQDIQTGAERAISVSDVADSSAATFVESVESGHADHGRQANLANALGMDSGAASLRLDSQAKFGVVARGQSAIYLRFAPEKDYDQYIWDIAVGAKIIEEAGGRVSDANGEPLNFRLGRTIGTGSLFASNGLLHERVLEAIRASSSS